MKPYQFSLLLITVICIVPPQGKAFVKSDHDTAKVEVVSSTGYVGDIRNLFHRFNPAFIEGMQNWRVLNCRIYKVIRHAGVRYVKVGPDIVSSPTLISAVIPLPSEFRNCDLEFSASMTGYINGISVLSANGRKLFWHNILADLPPENATKVRFVIPAGSVGAVESIYVRIFGFDTAFHDPARYFTVSNVQLIKATKVCISAPEFVIGHRGVNYTSYDTGIKFRWLTDRFNSGKVKKDIGFIQQIGNVVRLWASADNLSDFSDDGVWRCFNRSIGNLDSVFILFRNAGIKVIPTIFSQRSWSESEFSPRIITDTAVADGYSEMCAQFVQRFKQYDCIVGWDVCNESFGTTLTGHLSGKERFQSYPAAFRFMKRTFQKIKEADTVRPVIATFWFPFESWSLIAPEEYCDVVGYSVYLGDGKDVRTILQSQETSNSGPFLLHEKTLGLPFFISELGSPVISNDTGSAGRTELTYRDPVENARYLDFFLNRSEMFKGRSFLVWRDSDVLWSSDHHFRDDGRVLRDHVRGRSRTQ